MNNKLKEILELYAKIWQIQLHIEYKFKDKNVSNAFKGIGAFGEIFASLYNDGYVGSGSGGLGFDLINMDLKKEIEVKSSVTFQSNKCDNCGFKFSKIFDSCSICGSKKYKKINDSRFGINAKSLLEAYDKKIISKLVCLHIYDSKTLNFNDEQIIEFTINCYEIPFEYNDFQDERKRIDYFKNQFKSSNKSVHCNLLPESYDFFMLTPKFFDSWTIEINFKDLNVNPIIKNNWSDDMKNIKVKIDVCSKEEKEIFKKLNSYDESKHTVDLSDFVENFNYRKKSFNKKRGIIKKII